MNPTPADPTTPLTSDALVQRYHEAGALDGAAPGPALRAAVLAQAGAVARECAAQPPHPQTPAHPATDGAHADAAAGELDFSAGPLAPTPPVEAANDRRWAAPAVASLAVLGLAALLALQFERGADPRHAPDALAPPQAESSAGAAAPSPPAPPVAAQADAMPPSARRAPAPAAAREHARPHAEPAQAAPTAPSPALSPTQRNSGAPWPPTAPGAAPHAAPNASAKAATPPAPAPRPLDAVADEAARPVDAVDPDGRTALMRAAARGDAAQVQRLLDAGADPRRTDPQGHSAADYARRAGHVTLARLLERARAAAP
ncbi:MAG: ankyrin repeat domain-containing protein [Burkholderiaceae bacterium]